VTNDDPTLTTPRSPGRPKLRAERVVPRNVSLQPHEWEELEVLGRGSPSHGMRRALELARAWLTHIQDPE